MTDTPSGFFSQFTSGFMSFFGGLGLLARTPALWPYAILPFFIGTGLMIWGLVWAFGNLGAFIASFLTSLSFVPVALQGAVYWIGVLLAWPFFLIGLFFVVYLISKIIASPFHALLAERALISLGRIENHPFQLGPWLKISMRMFVVSLVKVFVFGTVGLVFLAMSFIPVVNLIAAFGFLLIAAFDCADYSFEALQFGFRDRLKFFRAHFPYFCGLAAALGLVFFVPGFNFLLFPAAVAGGSVLLGRIGQMKAPVQLRT